MDEELISKKELLELTGISYGQLYRWKRKNLIPEDWFIKKSTFTGQETFFRKEKILTRIDKIMNMKEDLSLDEIADMFTGLPSDWDISRDELIKRNIVSKSVVDLYIQQEGDRKVWSYRDIFCAFVADQALRNGDISLEEAKLLLETVTTNFQRCSEANMEILVTRKMGVSSCLLIEAPGTVILDKHTRTAARLSTSSCSEGLREKLT